MAPLLGLPVEAVSSGLFGGCFLGFSMEFHGLCFFLVIEQHVLEIFSIGISMFFSPTGFLLILSRVFNTSSMASFLWDSPGFPLCSHF